MSLADVVTVTGLHAAVETVESVVPVRGACLVEGTDTVDQVEPGWLAVTEGISLAHGPESVGRDLIRAIHQRGAAAIVVKLGRAWSNVPAGFIDEALHLKLPLYTMSGEMSVGYFLRYVHEATGIEDLAVLSRALAIQTDLLAALAYPDVEAELVRRLADSLRISAVLYGPDLQVIASQGAAPVHLIAETIHAHAGPRTRLGRWEVNLGSIETMAKAYWLALAWQPGQEPSAEVLRSSRRAIEQLLRAHSTTVATSRTQDYRQRAQLLSEFLSGVDEARLERLRDQLVLVRFPREGMFQVHMIRPVHKDPTWTSRTDMIATNVLEMTSNRGVQVLLGVHDGAFVVLHTGREEFSRLLLDISPSDHHGSSSTYSDLLQSRAAFRQAGISLSAGSRQGTFLPFYRVGFAEFVLGHVPAEELRVKADQELSGLAEYPSAIETLVHYLRHGLDVQATGIAMHLHPNSIRYRLAKIEEILGKPLNDPETLTVLYLSLHELIQSRSDKNAQTSDEDFALPFTRMKS